MDDLLNYFLSAVIGAVITAVFVTAVRYPEIRNTAYTKGITDCQQGTTSYTVIVGPEGVDTTYVYKP